MPTLLMLKGLPASGKSTYARELVKTKDWYRVNKDDLRAMVHDSRWGKEREKFILHWRDAIIKDGLGGLKNVVVDDTNFAPKHEINLRAMAKLYGAEFEVKFFDTPVEECIKRDLSRENSVGAKVIMQMYDQFLKPPAEIYAPPEGMPQAIICDIDGTLAHMVDRSPFDWHKVGSDTLDRTVAGILRRYWVDDPMNDEREPQIILLSGRDSVCRPETEKWLHDNGVLYDQLFMRTAADMRKDSIVKRELFDEHIRDKYQVLFILDDRDQVVEMWRQMGLKVLQVAKGDF